MAVLLHVGGSGEHLYLLCHLLCCPAGVGKWAAPFLQVSQGNSLSFIVVMSVVVHTEFIFLISTLDPSYREHLWNPALYASSGHPYVTCQVFAAAPLTITLSYSLTETYTISLYALFSIRIHVILSGSNSLTSLTGGFCVCVTQTPCRVPGTSEAM